MLGNGSFKFHRARWEDVPFQYPIINALAALPVRGAARRERHHVGRNRCDRRSERRGSGRSGLKTHKEDSMPAELPPIRRIVTGDSPDGRSRIIADGEPPVVATAASRPGWRNANIWSTSATPAPVDAPDRIAEHKGLYPPKNGTVIRVMDIPPEPQDKAELAAWYTTGQRDDVSRSRAPDGRQDQTSRHAHHRHGRLRDHSVR